MLLLNEGLETVAIASKAGFRCFTSTQDFKDYVEKEILAGGSRSVASEAVGAS